MGRLFFAMSLQRPKPRVRWLSYGGSISVLYFGRSYSDFVACALSGSAANC
jgi:hypothetical protein